MNLSSLIKSHLTNKYINSTTVLFLFASPLIIINYLVFILNPQNIDFPLIWLIQVLADGISIFVVLNLWMTILLELITPYHHRKYKLEQIKFLTKTKPSIDIFITVAGEPLKLVKQTIDAAIKMDYPHKTFVLDDGHSKKLKLYCQKNKVEYVTRKNKLYAKAGNINNGLKHSKADFFAILDADQIPKKEFITTLLPYMEEKNLAIVQSPQYFYNSENFIAHGTAESQKVFYQHICPAKNISNSAFCVGTNVIFRRKAIDKIGGIAQLSHSEDIWTSYKLHEEGFKSLFVNKVLAKGQAPEKINSFLKQQLRWAKGGLSMLFTQNPLKSEKLTIDQKIHYFGTNSFYLIGISILIYILLPILYLLLGLKGINTDSMLTWIIHYIPYFALYYGLTWMLMGQVTLSTLSTAISVFYPYILALIHTIFGKEQKWIATSATSSNDDIKMKWIWPHILILMLSIFSIFIGWINPINFWATVYNSLWVFINMYLLYIFVTGEKRIVKIN